VEKTQKSGDVDANKVLGLDGSWVGREAGWVKKWLPV
jgi:hypothetical protein